MDLIADELLVDSGQKPSIKYDPPDLAPQIYIEDRGKNRLHVTVIGSFWEDVLEVQRPAIILDAFRKAGRTQVAEQISIAMGLTPGEAEALGMEEK